MTNRTGNFLLKNRLKLLGISLADDIALINVNKISKIGIF